MFNVATPQIGDSVASKLREFLYEKNYFNDDYENDFRPIILGSSLIVTTDEGEGTISVEIPSYNFI